MQSDIHPREIIAARVLLLYVLCMYYWLFIPGNIDGAFIPFLRFFGAVPGIAYILASVVLLVAVINIFLLKKYYRISAFAAGGVILFFIFSSKLLFSNSLTFAACLLLLIGLNRRNDFFYRIQISLLYFGAGINKVFTPDWWSGAYIDNFLRNIYEVDLYSNWIPPGQLYVAEIVGLSVIVIELMLAVIVLFPKLTRSTIIAGLLFHGGMLIITSGELSLRFFYIMSAAFLLVSGLNFKPVHVLCPSGLLKFFIGLFDLTDTIRFDKDTNKQFRVTAGKSTYAGKKAVSRLFISKQGGVLFWFGTTLFFLVLPKIL